MDPELEELPTDYLRGLDFRITKTAKGGYADYNTSKWARKESALTEEEQAAIDTHGLWDLSTFMPKKPDEAAVKVIKEMFEASVDGAAYDTERWGSYFRPAGVAAPASNAESVPTPQINPAPKAAPVVDSDFDEDEPAVAAAPVVKATAAPTQKAEDILAMIRSRQQK
jgi:hypothetical protein